MTLVSWAKKELARMKLQSPKRLLPPRTTLNKPAKSLVPAPQIPEVVLAADLRCKRCQERLAATLSNLKNDWESIEVHIVEKKATLKTIANVDCI